MTWIIKLGSEGGLLFPQLGQGGEEGKLIEAILLGNQVF